jgi:hypothetical protein
VRRRDQRRWRIKTLRRGDRSGGQGGRERVEAAEGTGETEEQEVPGGVAEGHTESQVAL